MTTTPTLRLDGKVAVVTGGGRGLGRGIATGLAAQGASVVINDLFREDDGTAAAELVAAEIRTAGGTAVACLDNIASFDGGEAVVSAALDAFGRVDILVTCAGNFRRSLLLDLEEEEWDAVLPVHLTGTAGCVRAAARAMVAQGEGGRIVTVSSRGAFFGPQVAYSGAKAAIMGLSASAAIELAPYGITVNCLLPSAMTQLFSSPATSRRFGGMPETLSMDPDQVATLVEFLASPAAGEITGRFLYAAGTDLCVYAEPLQLAGATTFIRNAVPWQVDDLAGYLPGVLGA